MDFVIGQDGRFQPDRDTDFFVGRDHRQGAPLFWKRDTLLARLGL